MGATSNPTKELEARIDAWLEHLAAATDEAAMDAAFQAYVTAMGRFWTYSDGNSLLILLQCPAATHVASRKRWEALGYRLKPGVQTGIWGSAYPSGPLKIRCPDYKIVTDLQTGEETKVLVRFNTGPVFDYSQVEPGPHPQPLTPPWQEIAGDYGAVYRTLCQVCAQLDITVEVRPIEGRAKGRSEMGRIVLSDALDSGNRAHILLHELAHELVHSAAARLLFSKQEKECQAEAIAYCVAEELGLPSPNSPTYLALYHVDKETLRANLHAIQRGVQRILREVERVSTASRSMSNAA